MTRIFVAHAACDRQSALRLADALRSKGHLAFADEDELPTAVTMPGQIARGLRDADCMALCISRPAVENGWLDTELNLTPPAHFSGRVVPVRLDDTPLPKALAEVSGIDLFPDGVSRATGIETLARIFAGYEGEEAASSAFFPPNNLPRRRPFIGREAALGALAKGGAITVVETTHHGFGGAGKSALVLEYAHQHGGSYPGGVWWLDASGDPTSALASLADDLRAFAPQPIRGALASLADDATTLDIAHAVRRALEAHGDTCLLVLDDAEPEMWREQLPGGEVRVVLTANVSRGAVGEILPLAPLAAAEAKAMAELIAGMPHDLDEEQALGRVVSHALSGLPLAIEAAARVVREIHRSWARYEAELGARAAALDEEAALYGGYAPAVLAAIDRSIERCASGDVSRHVLEAAAVFAPRAVPLDWIGQTAVLDADDAEWRQALRVLRGLGLLTIDRSRETASMHPLVHLRVRRRVAGAAEWRRIRLHGAEFVARWLEDTLGDEAAKERAIGARRPHIEEALASADRAGEDRLWIRIADRLAKHLDRRGALDEMSALLERAAAKAGGASR